MGCGLKTVMRRSLPAVLAALVLLAGTDVVGQTIKEIVIVHEGIGIGDTSFTLAHIGSKEGQEFDSRRTSGDARRLLATGRFSDVQVTGTVDGDDVIITYAVVNRPSLAVPVTVIGANHFSEGRIRRTLDVSVGDLVDEGILAVRGRKVADEYREAGYRDVELEWDISVADAEKGTVSAVLTVTEGGKLARPEVAFVGNTVATEAQLRRALGRRAWWNLAAWFESYDPDNETPEVLRTWYVERGYLDARVSNPVEAEDDRGERTVTYTIDEGVLYRVGEVTLEDVDSFLEADVAKVIGLVEGEPVSETNVRESAEAVRRYYSSRGYLRARVRPVPKMRIDEEAGCGVLDVAFVVTEGNLMKIRNVYIRGNTLTHDHVIRRELLTYPGDVFDERKVRVSEGKLWGLGYFSKVLARQERTPDLTEYDLVYEVEEQRTGSIQVGGGFSSIDDFVGFVEFMEGNFDMTAWPPKGAGQKLQFRSQFGSITTSTELKFVEPWLFGRKLSLGVELYATGRDLSDYDVRRIGGAISLGRSLNPGAVFFTRADVRYKLEDATIDDVTDTNLYYRVGLDGEMLSGPEEEYLFAYEDSLESSVTLTLTRNKLDAYLFPSRGHRVILSGNVSGGVFGGDARSYSWTAKGEKYFPLWHDHVLGVKAKAQVVDSYGGDELPIFNRLFIGGRLLRGFEYRGVGPKAARTDESGYTTYRMIGGKTLAMAGAEYSIPVFKQIKLVGFIDTGNVWEDAYDFSFDNMASSAGLELRLDVPQFPIRVNYAWVLEKDNEATEEQYWNLWIGPGF